MKLTVLSLGGSIIVPSNIDVAFLSLFKKAIVDYLEEKQDEKLILVTGGGATARLYQNALKELDKNTSLDSLDYLGIKATHLNGTLLNSLFYPLAKDELITNPTIDSPFTGRILVAAGWKPGFSTDTDAVYLAKKYGGKLVINLSNIAKVYSDDPKKNKDAKPIDKITWKDFRKIVGDEWVPGKNTPFDPIASAIAEKENMKVICADGKNINNLIAILKGETFIGTLISDET